MNEEAELEREIRELYAYHEAWSKDINRYLQDIDADCARLEKMIYNISAGREKDHNKLDQLIEGVVQKIQRQNDIFQYYKKVKERYDFLYTHNNQLTNNNNGLDLNFDDSDDYGYYSNHYS